MLSGACSIQTVSRTVFNSPVSHQLPLPRAPRALSCTAALGQGATSTNNRPWARRASPTSPAKMSTPAAAPASAPAPKSPTTVDTPPSSVPSAPPSPSAAVPAATAAAGSPALKRLEELRAALAPLRDGLDLPASQIDSTLLRVANLMPDHPPALIAEAARAVLGERQGPLEAEAEAAATQIALQLLSEAGRSEVEATVPRIIADRDAIRRGFAAAEAARARGDLGEGEYVEVRAGLSKGLLFASAALQVANARLAALGGRQ